GDVPALELIGSGGQQFRLRVGRMSRLVAAFARFALLFQEAMHGANRAVIVPFIEQRRINSGWGAILEPFSVKMSQDCKRRSENRPRHAVRAGDAAEEK